MALKIKHNLTDDGNWFKLHDAAELLSISEITLRRKIKSGKIVSELKNGKYYVFLNESEYKEKKKKLINIEKFLLEKEDEIKKLRTQIFDQKILINALEAKLKNYAKK